MRGSKHKDIQRRYMKYGYCHWIGESPSWFVNLYMTRPARRRTKHILHKIKRGYDPDGANFPLVHKPHVYFH